MAVAISAPQTRVVLTAAAWIQLLDCSILVFTGLHSSLFFPLGSLLKLLDHLYRLTTEPNHCSVILNRRQQVVAIPFNNVVRNWRR